MVERRRRLGVGLVISAVASDGGAAVTIPSPRGVRMSSSSAPHFCCFASRDGIRSRARGLIRSNRMATPMTEISWNSTETDHLIESSKPHARDSTDEGHGKLPKHVAFICDGNSRWSDARNLPKSAGHLAGADRLINIIEALQSSYAGVEYCTLFAFSTENFSRPRSEVDALFRIMQQVARQYRRQEAIRDGRVQVELLGDVDDGRIPIGAREELQKLQSDSKRACSARRTKDRSHRTLTINLAINYGGRADILQASRRLAQAIVDGEVSPDAVLDESEISTRLWTARLPDPDLIVRTGGNTRLSNFFLWETAYSELYFSDLMWPDFDDTALEEALRWFSETERRFGGR